MAAVDGHDGGGTLWNVGPRRRRRRGSNQRGRAAHAPLRHAVGVSTVALCWTKKKTWASTSFGVGTRPGSSSGITRSRPHDPMCTTASPVVASTRAFIRTSSTASWACTTSSSWRGTRHSHADTRGNCTASFRPTASASSIPRPSAPPCCRRATDWARASPFPTGTAHKPSYGRRVAGDVGCTCDAHTRVKGLQNKICAHRKAEDIMTLNVWSAKTMKNTT